MTQDELDKAFDDLHKCCIETMEYLIDLDPPEGSAEFNLLKNLAKTVDHYERLKYPVVFRSPFRPEDEVEFHIVYHSGFSKKKLWYTLNEILPKEVYVIPKAVILLPPEGKRPS